YAFFSSTHPATPELHTLSLHDALPISWRQCPPPLVRSMSRRRHGRRHTPQRSARGTPSIPRGWRTRRTRSMRTTCRPRPTGRPRSEEHTSELQSPYDLVCRLLLEKKKK